MDAKCSRIKNHKQIIGNDHTIGLIDLDPKKLIKFK